MKNRRDVNKKKRLYMQTKRENNVCSTPTKPRVSAIEEIKDGKGSVNTLVNNSIKKNQQIADAQENNLSQSPDPEDLQVQVDKLRKTLKPNQVQEKILSKLETIGRNNRDTRQKLFNMENKLEEVTQTNRDILSMLGQFIQNTSATLHNVGYLSTQIMMKSFNAHGKSFKIDLRAVEKQVQEMKVPEHDILERTCNQELFWKYVSKVSYVQFAIYMICLHAGSAKSNTIKNNLNTFVLFSKLYKAEGTISIRFEDLMKGTDLIQRQYSKLREISTLKGYLAHFTTMVRTVYGFKEFAAKVQYKNYGQRKSIISKDELLQIIDVYKNSKEELPQLIGFFLYLLLQTGQRNETIRTLEFDQFVVSKSRTGEELYSVQTFAAKTGKSSSIQIPHSAYLYVLKIQKSRLDYINKQLNTLDTSIDADNKKLDLLNRRQKYLFTFYSQSSLHYHVKKLKAIFSNKFAAMNKFIIHNIRTIRIRAAYEEGGLDLAKEVGQHQNVKTTVDHYLDLNAKIPLLEWMPQDDLIIDEKYAKDVQSKDNEDEDEEEVQIRVFNNDNLDDNEEVKQEMIDTSTNKQRQ